MDRTTNSMLRKYSANETNIGNQDLIIDIVGSEEDSPMRKRSEQGYLDPLKFSQINKSHTFVKNGRDNFSKLQTQKQALHGAFAHDSSKKIKTAKNITAKF